MWKSVLREFQEYLKHHPKPEDVIEFLYHLIAPNEPRVVVPYEAKDVTPYGECLRVAFLYGKTGDEKHLNFLKRFCGVKEKLEDADITPVIEALQSEFLVNRRSLWGIYQIVKKGREHVKSKP